MLALLVTSASHIPPGSHLVGPVNLAQRWQGIFHRSTVEGAHRPTFVCAHALPPSADSALSEQRTHCICHHTHIHTHTANSDIKPGPDVGILSLYCIFSFRPQPFGLKLYTASMKSKNCDKYTLIRLHPCIIWITKERRLLESLCGITKYNVWSEMHIIFLF